jgi:hypothetical protein
MRQSLEPAANEIAMLYTTSSTTLTHDKAEATSKATIAGPYGIGGGPNWGSWGQGGFYWVSSQQFHPRNALTHTFSSPEYE